MIGTIENTNHKINEKISCIKRSIEILYKLHNKLSVARAGKKYIKVLDDQCVSAALVTLEQIETNYNLCVINILSEYYSDTKNEDKKTEDYYRIIISENFIAKIDDIILEIKNILAALGKIVKPKLFPRAEFMQAEENVAAASKLVEQAHRIQINLAVEKRNYEICKCGYRMIVVPELSELH